jgi:hypothetical protein
MATKKKTTRSERSPAPARAGGISESAILRANDVMATQGRAVNDVAAALPFNALKEFEYGHDHAKAPRAGASVDVPAALTASTTSEENVTPKTGGSAISGVNATIASLDRVRADGSDQALTTDQGVPIGDNQSSLKAGLRGPTLLEDFILREKITHFDHERIPERIVHARGSGAHGFFEAYDAITELTRAAPFAAAGKVTPVFARFSTVAGGAGSKDTARDVRGFAVKFYTDEGNWDLVGKPEKFAEHYAQATLFFDSQTDVEKAHIIAAFRFELSKVAVPAIRERMLASLVNVSMELAVAVAAGLGMDLPEGLAKALATAPKPEVKVSPALSLTALPGECGIRTRQIALLVADGVHGASSKGKDPGLLMAERDRAAVVAPAFIAAIAAHRHPSRDSDPPKL